ncbi:50S ribosomal protein L11 methyltransferase [Candidatus Poriferisodalis sp.]|uniref:50S ribosomal protein L11 methyltransferase n=1 Tax=Candidatus Poriferisodalis sp. TaxID=3101277 RepID=UPI003B022D17
MSDPPPVALWGDERYGGACLVLADDVVLGTADGGGLPDRGLPTPLMPEQLAAAALAVAHEWLGRGRWVSRIRVTDDRSARRLVAELRAGGHAVVLGPPDEAHAVGWRNRNRAVPVGGKLAVCFPWADADAPAVVEVDPGEAFGAGTHPSTRLLAEWLAERITGGERVLDVGCGSGVLALIAARLGAAEAVGIDIEPAAISAAEANARRNGLDRVSSFGTFPVGHAELGTFDVVVANITADVLIALAGDIAARVAPGGRLAVSGISAGQASSVAAAYRPHGIELTDPVRLDDWVSVDGRRTRSGEIRGV